MKERPLALAGPDVRGILNGQKTQLRVLLKPQPLFAPGKGRLVHDSEYSREPCAPFHGQAVDPTRWWLSDEKGPARSCRCPFGVVGDRLWIRENFWAMHDTDTDGYRTIDCGPGLDLGPAHHPGIQYCATPGNWKRPHEPGDWYPQPPDDWNGVSEPVESWSKEWAAWELFTKFSAARMPRWCSRLSLEVLQIRGERLQDIGEADAEAEGVEAWDGLLKEAALYRRAKDMGACATDARVWFAEIWDRSHARTAPFSSNPMVWVLEKFRRVT